MLVGFPVGVPPVRRMILRAVRNVDQRCNASRLDNLNSTRPSRRRPAKEIRSTTPARLRCRDGLNSAVYLQKPKQPRPFKLLPGRPLRILVNDPTILLYSVGTLCFHVLGVSARHSRTRVCRTSSIPFPIARSTAYLSSNAPLSSVSLLSLLSLPLLVALLCITNLRFQFMMGVCIAIILRL